MKYGILMVACAAQIMGIIVAGIGVVKKSRPILTVGNCVAVLAIGMTLSISILAAFGG